MKHCRHGMHLACHRSVLIAIVLFSGDAMAEQATAYRVSFGNSCSPQVQTDFGEAVTLLHSFEYPETSRIFKEVLEVDPGCAMAHWGAAMSLWHPLWAPPGQSELEAGARHLEAAGLLAMTARERAYVDALQAFFSSADTATHVLRARAYEQRMKDVYLEYLDDHEAAVFYALALLATADPHDKSYSHQFKAAGILNWVAESEPGHPGVMHYLIHSYDYPGLAHLALGVAKRYAKAAPDSAHAQHMPSHIFTRLGLWDLSLSSNHDSTRSAAAYTEMARLPGFYDEGLHSMDYLMYALMQTARDDDAQDLLSRLAKIGKTNTENFKVAYTYDFAWDEFGWAKSIHHFARGLGAARSGDAKAARQELDIIEALHAALPASTLPYWKEGVQVHIESVSSWIALAEGRTARALALAAAAANREDAVDKHPVTPGEVLPARELYADMLFETGSYAEALAQYRSVLRISPNRLNALVGAANSATRIGEAELAGRFRAAIRAQAMEGSPRRAGLDAFLDGD